MTCSLNHVARLVLIMILLSTSVPLMAGEWDFGGALRTRWEDRNDFNFIESSQDYLLTRVRLNGKWQSDGGTVVFVELQDARVFEEDPDAFPGLNENAVPTVFKDELDVFQAFVIVPLGESGKVKIGRQTLNIGDKRLIASLEWVNTARVHDGIRITYGNTKERALELFATRVVPVNPENLNDWSRTRSRYFNSSFHGAWYTDRVSIPDGSFNVYLLYREESEIDDRTFTLGGSVNKRVGPVEVSVQGGIQAGDYGGLDHEAFFLTLDAWYNAEWNGTRYGLSYNWGSGDDNPNDDEHGSFDNLYPLNHAYYGYMDFFGLPNMNNLELVFQTNVFETAKFRVGLHRFELNQPDTDGWYNAPLNQIFRPTGQNADDHAGDEIDITLAAPFLDNRFKAVLGVSRFFPGDYLDERGRDNEADFWFVQTAYKF